jgi:serine/threonine protein kinase
MSTRHDLCRGHEYVFTPANGRATIASPSRGAVPLHTEASGTAPPDAFGPFRVLHQVGAGALGPVFRAYDSDRSRLVAVKVFQLDLPPERVHRLVAELETLVAAELTHPAIAAPLATGTDGIVVYLVQEYVAADSLDVVMSDHGLASPGDPLRVAAQLAAALDFAAAVNVHHGVLHPRDVLISPDDARLTGLGVAGAIEKAGVAAQLRRPYTAPERIAGGAWDRRADVFSLAALVHEMLWGRRLTAIGEEAALALTELPGSDLAGLRAAFACALAAKPTDRFETAHEFAEALNRAFPGLDSRQSPVAGRQSIAEPRLPLDDPPVRVNLEDRSRPEMAIEDGLHAVRGADLELRTRPDPTADALGELELRGEETVDSHPVAVPAPLRTAQLLEMPPTRPRSVLLDRYEPDPHESDPPELISRREPSLREGPVEPAPMWPVAAALMLGIALGFGGGYTLAGRRAAPAPAPSPSLAPGAAAPPGREWTESAVNEPSSPNESSSAVLSRPDSASRGEAVQPAPDAAVRTGDGGRLLVRSTPAGARVFVDGRAQGRTPATVLDLARGAHRLRVARAGYVDEDRRIVVTAGRPTQSVTFDLKRPPGAMAASRAQAPPHPETSGAFTGAALNVDSRPGGARVYIDGRLVGTTPVSVPQVGAGEHAIRLERDGYRRWSSSIRIVTGEPNRVTASLEK